MARSRDQVTDRSDVARPSISESHSIGWRDTDDRLRTGARTALDRLLNPGHVETYDRGGLDWQSWNIWTAVAGGPGRTVASLHATDRGIGHSSNSSAAVIRADGTIVADHPGSESLTVLRTWLRQWKAAGRPPASRYQPTLEPADGDPPGWNLHLSLRPDTIDGSGGTR